MSSPNPNWKPGDQVKSPPQNFIKIDPAEISAAEAYKLMIGSIVPRPIAFISTVNAKGEGNLAPFSFFNGVCSDPPCVVISISRKSESEKKDTLRNIEETGQFVINSANKWLIEPLVYSAGSFDFGINEMKVVGLTPEPSIKVKPFRVRESAVQFECELYQTVQIGNTGPTTSALIIGKIVMFHVMESVYQSGKISIDAFQPVARLGGINYSTLGEIFSIPVPDVTKK